MSFFFIYVDIPPTQQIKIQIQISWVGWSNQIKLNITREPFEENNNNDNSQLLLQCWRWRGRLLRLIYLLAKMPAITLELLQPRWKNNNASPPKVFQPKRVKRLITLSFCTLDCWWKKHWDKKLLINACTSSNFEAYRFTKITFLYIVPKNHLFWSNISHPGLITCWIFPIQNGKNNTIQEMKMILMRKYP